MLILFNVDLFKGLIIGIMLNRLKIFKKKISYILAKLYMYIQYLRLHGQVYITLLDCKVM